MDQRGVTLLELLLAVVIAGLLLASSFIVLNKAAQLREKSWQRRTAAILVREQIEDFKMRGLSGATFAPESLYTVKRGRTEYTVYLFRKDFYRSLSLAQQPAEYRIVVSAHQGLDTLFDGQFLQGRAP